MKTHYDIQILTEMELAQMLQIDVQTVIRLRNSGRIPYLRIAKGLLRYNLYDVVSALTERKRGESRLPLSKPRSILGKPLGSARKN